MGMMEGTMYLESRVLFTQSLQLLQLLRLEGLGGAPHPRILRLRPPDGQSRRGLESRMALTALRIPQQTGRLHRAVHGFSASCEGTVPRAYPDGAGRTGAAGARQAEGPGHLRGWNES